MVYEPREDAPDWVSAIVADLAATSGIDAAEDRRRERQGFETDGGAAEAEDGVELERDEGDRHGGRQCIDGRGRKRSVPRR